VKPLVVGLQLALAVTVVPQALAQQDGAQLALEEIVVSARKRSENLQDVPMTVAAFDAELLKNLQVRDVTDLQTSVANLFLTEGRSVASGSLNASIRGVGSPVGEFEPGVAIYIDDTYVLSATGQLLDLLDTERVEVLKGPQGHLYGRNTTGGAVKFVSKRPTEEFSGSLEVQAGSEGYSFVRGSVSGGLTETLAGSLTLVSEQRDGFQKDVNTGDEYWDIDNLAGRVALTWAPTDDVTIDFSYSSVEDDSAAAVPVLTDSLYSREELLEISALTGHTLPEGLQQYEFLSLERSPDSAFNDEDDVSANLPQDDFNIETQFVNLSVSWDINDNWSVRSITSYFDKETVLTFELDGTANAALDNSAVSEEEQFSQEFQLIWSSDRVEAVVGVYYLDYDEQEPVTDFTGQNTSVLINPLVVGGVQSAVAGLTGETPSIADTINVWIPAFGVEDRLQPPSAFPSSLVEPKKNNIESKAIFANFDIELTDKLNLQLGGRYTEDDKEAYEVQGDHYALAALFVDATGQTYWYDDQIAGATEAMIAQLGQPLVLNPSLNVPLGIETTDDSGSWDDFSYLVGVSYEVSDDVLVYGSVSTGFKSGGFNSIERADLRTYDEETIETYVLGVKSTLLEGSLVLNAELFLNEIDDMQFQSFAFVDGDVDSVTGNFGEAETKGIDITATWLATSNLRFDANIGYLDAEITKAFETQEGDDGPVTVEVSDFLEMGRAPEFTGTLTARYNWSLGNAGNLELIAQYYYSDEAYTIQPWDSRAQFQTNAVQDSYDIWNAQLVWTSSEGNWRAFVGGKNLADERVVVDSFDLGLSTLNSAYNAPRTYTAGVEYRWGD
jgi:iron complex outermembrane receptor protein